MLRCLRDFICAKSFIIVRPAEARFAALLQVARNLTSRTRALRVASGGIVLLAILTMMVPPVAFAEKHSVEVTEAEAAVGKIARKFLRGIVNVLTGWLELPVQIYKVSANEGILHGASIGFLSGIGMTVVRTGAGAIDTALFLIPLPEDYRPLLKPEFVWTPHGEESASSLIRSRAFAGLPEHSSPPATAHHAELDTSFSTEAKSGLLQTLELLSISTPTTISKMNASCENIP